MPRLMPIAMTLALVAISACAASISQPVRVIMATALGDIEIELYPDKAPVTAGNFLALVDGDHLDGASFYRTVSPANDNGRPVISVVQGGIGDAEGLFPPIAHETTAETGLLHLDGSLSMARGEVGTATTEFLSVSVRSQRSISGPIAMPTARDLPSSVEL